MLSGEIKKCLIDCITPMVQDHQQHRAAVTEAHVDQFMSTAPRSFASLFGDYDSEAPEPPVTPAPGGFSGGMAVAIGAPGSAGEAASGGSGKGGSGGSGGDDAAAAVGEDGQPLSKNALKKLQKEKEIAAKKAAKAAEKAAKAQG